MDTDLAKVDAFGNNVDTRVEYYDLSGRQISNPTKGIYIHDGKKVVIK